jgi:DNA-binding MurR/RpiR family transcriptional regulator
MSAFAKLRESNFSVTEKRIADYILQHSAELPDLSISTIAEECETSKSMVVQLCKTAGFKGYKDLSSQLLVEQAISDHRQETVYEDIHPGCSVSQICQITIRAELRSIRDTEAMIDPDAITKAVEWMSTAGLIQLFGVGGSGVAALDLYNKLTRIGINARYSQDTHCQMLETSSLNDKTVVVVFSYNGRTKDMIEAVELSKAMGARIISITRYGNNPTSDLAGHSAVRGQQRVAGTRHRDELPPEHAGHGGHALRLPGQPHERPHPGDCRTQHGNRQTPQKIAAQGKDGAYEGARTERTGSHPYRRRPAQGQADRPDDDADRH